MERWDRQAAQVVSEPLIERRQAPVFDIGIALARTYRTFGAGKITSANHTDGVKPGDQHGGMKVPVWSLQNVLVRGQVTGSADKNSAEAASTPVVQCTTVSDSDDVRQVLWTGLRLEFFRDGGESYWHTLVGKQQELFVVCQDDEEGELMPILVTADYDEAMAYQEADDTILSAPMPEKIYLALERFVLENYTPVEKKRRKRKKWHGGEQDEAFARKPVS